MKVRKKQLTITCKIFLCSWKNCLFLKFHFLVVYWPLTWWWWWWRWLLGNFFVCLLISCWHIIGCMWHVPKFILIYYGSRKKKQVSKIIYQSILGCVSLYGRRWWWWWWWWYLNMDGHYWKPSLPIIIIIIIIMDADGWMFIIYRCRLCTCACVLAMLSTSTFGYYHWWGLSRIKKKDNNRQWHVWQ